MKGWSIQVTRKNGSTFLATNGQGHYPVIFVGRARKDATEFKRELSEDCSNVRVVPVEYEEPVVLEKKK